jgi:hypothetical protein
MGKGWWAALFFCATGCLVSLHLGQDINFDLKGYHLHNGWAVWNGRWSQDLFAAGPATFFSPFLDVPYYLAAMELFPSHGEWVVAFAGLPYGVLLYLIYLTSRRIADSLELEKWDRAAFIAASVALAGTGAATWSEIGTTFNDIPIAVMALAALHQILIAVAGDGEPAPRRVAAAGMLLGLAMGLKLTAAVYVLAMGGVIFLVADGWRNRIRSVSIYGGCAVAVFVAIYGPWAWRLYELTGNPFFPMLNGVFRSDWIASVNFTDERFLPRSWLQWLFYPFHWATLQSSVVTELPFRDVRLAVAYVLVAGYMAIALAGKHLKTRLVPGTYRSVHVLVLFLALSYIVWLRQFSIFRYQVATECLAGMFIIVGAMALARPLGRRATWLPALCVIAIAGFIIGYTVPPQWGRAPVRSDTFAVAAPEFEPGALIVFVDNSMSFMAPGLAAAGRDLRFMTIPRWFASGAQPGAPRVRYELERRMKAKIAENARSFYVLFERSDAPPGANLAEFDVQVDMASCRPGRASLGAEFVACRGVYPIPQPAISR